MENKFIDPTYLRYVYDGLAQGRISADNASDLPHGLVGLYEELFPPSMPTAQRQQLLERFCTWALLRREVTTTLVACLWQQTEEEVMEFIRTHSRWFASPKQGHYRLYHDKLRTYFLQRLAPNDVSRLNEGIISRLQEALQQQDGKDTEHYALQYLADHLWAESQLGESYEELNRLCQKKDLVARQIAVAQSYQWSQRMLRLGAMEGFRRRCGNHLAKHTASIVQLTIAEQNSAGFILHLLNSGNYVQAIERAQSWPNERKAKLLLLMLHELTIGTSKDEVFSVSAASIVLKNMEAVKDVSWGWFYSYRLVCKYQEKFIQWGLDSSPLWEGMGELSDPMFGDEPDDYGLYYLMEVFNDESINSRVKASILKFVPESDGQRELARGALSLQLMREQRVDAARELALGIEFDDIKMRILSELALVAGRSGNLSVAKQLVKGVQELSLSTKEDWSHYEAFVTRSRLNILKVLDFTDDDSLSPGNKPIASSDKGEIDVLLFCVQNGFFDLAYNYANKFNWLDDIAESRYELVYRALSDLDFNLLIKLISESKFISLLRIILRGIEADSLRIEIDSRKSLLIHYAQMVALNATKKFNAISESFVDTELTSIAESDDEIYTNEFFTYSYSIAYSHLGMICSVVNLKEKALICLELADEHITEGLERSKKSQRFDDYLSDWSTAIIQVVNGSNHIDDFNSTEFVLKHLRTIMSITSDYLLFERQQLMYPLNMVLDKMVPTRIGEDDYFRYQLEQLSARERVKESFSEKVSIQLMEKGEITFSQMWRDELSGEHNTSEQTYAELYQLLENHGMIVFD